MRANLNRNYLAGSFLSVKILDLDKFYLRCVCTNIQQRKTGLNTKNFISSVCIGQIVYGHVQNLTNFGVFIQIGALNALLHISQISNSRVGTVYGVFAISEPIKCMVIGLDIEKNRISLTTKKLEIKSGDMLRNRKICQKSAEFLAVLFRERITTAEAAVI